MNIIKLLIFRLNITMEKDRGHSKSPIDQKRIREDENEENSDTDIVHENNDKLVDKVVPKISKWKRYRENKKKTR